MVLYQVLSLRQYWRQASALTATGKYARLAYARPLRYHDERLLAWARFVRPDASQLGGFLAGSFIFDSHKARNLKFLPKELFRQASALTEAGRQVDMCRCPTPVIRYRNDELLRWVRQLGCNWGGILDKIV